MLEVVKKRRILTDQLRLVRRTARRLAQMLRWRRLSLHGVPVLFANSFPKSGTHLLTQVLQGFPQIGPAVESGLPAVVTYEGDTGRARPEGEVMADLRRLLPGDIGYGHVHALPGPLDLLGSDGYAAYFILRDPRDVVVSHVHYITGMQPGHIHHRHYTEELHSFDERLRTSILGLSDPQIPFPDICARFEPYLAWLDCAGVLTLRFEDFILDRPASLERVLAHAEQRGFPLQVERGRALQLLDEAINPQRSPTFRSGKVGGWKAQFSPENIRLFKEIASDLLIRLGYETGTDW
jgi:hypothetical protein